MIKTNTLFVLLAGLIGFSPIVLSQSSTQPQAVESALPSLAPILTKTMPAVVNIAVQGELPPAVGKDKEKDDQEDDNAQPGPRERGGEGGKGRKFESIGSGVIVQPQQGYIITNSHVIRNAKTIVVTMNDGRRLNAKLIGEDTETDIAVLQVKAEGLQTLPTADSDQLQVGDFVIAIGNPFGLNTYGSNQTATFGIISALHRSDINLEGVENFIQTDAAINPGNSGGALVNTKGELIGINTAILSPYGGNVGIGFAIPINMVRSITEQIIKYGSVTRGLMGIYVQQLTPELADAFGIARSKGAIVTQVNAGSPAERAGLKPADVIQGINGRPITDATQVKNIISLLRIDSVVKMDILRDGQKQQLSAVVTDVKKNEEKLQSKNPFLYGLALRNIDQESPAHGYVTGVQVVAATENSPGWRAGIRPGDVIVSVNKKPVTNLKELQRDVEKSKSDLLVRILRGPGSLFVLIIK